MPRILVAAVLSLSAPASATAATVTKPVLAKTYVLKCEVKEVVAVQNTTGATIPTGARIRVRIAVGRAYPHVTSQETVTRVPLDRALFYTIGAAPREARSCSATVTMIPDVLARRAR